MDTTIKEPLFKKLKIRSLLDLALIVPTRYDDTTLGKPLVDGTTITAEAQVRSIQKKTNQLLINFYLPLYKKEVKAIFFNVTPYHYQTFTPHSTHFIKGKITHFMGTFQISQPKKIAQAGIIIPTYKTPLKESEMRELVSSCIKSASLRNLGLREEEIKTLLLLHFPKDLSEIYDQNKMLKAPIIHQLKELEAYAHFKKLQGKKVDFPPASLLNGSPDDFIKSLPFTLTDDQLETISAIQSDLQNSKKAAKRVIVGDVGSGKTMVILAAAMIAYPKKSILMAPTSLLAMQLFEEASKYLKDIKIALVTQNKKEGDYKDATLIIGTHALLHLDDLPKVELIMIDEQHRFGVMQRNKLEKLAQIGKKRAHMLQFSATPIPRTQAMMDSALIDISLITHTPFKKNITTKVISKEDFKPLLSHIDAEIAKNNQVLIVYPLVEESEQIPYQSIDEARGFWEKNYERVFVTHGKDKEKQDVLLDFRELGNILLATTVVEVGISLPRLTTIIIVAPERLGLATLHQLRGRVGRHGQEATCFLYTNDKNNQRLEKFAKTDNGFEIARLDLLFRNSGDILEGTMQSGYKFRWLDMANDEAIIAKAKERAKV